MKTNEDYIRNVIKNSVEEGDENLTSRIMHQINAEKELLPKSIKKDDHIREFISTFSVMYGLIFMLGSVRYLQHGTFQWNSIQFLLPSFFIVMICSLFWFITTFDNKRMES